MYFWSLICPLLLFWPWRVLNVPSLLWRLLSCFSSCPFGPAWGFSEPVLNRFFSFPIHWSVSDERWCDSNSTLSQSLWLSTDDLHQAWPLGASYSQSNQQETEQSTVHCVMLSPWSQCWCVSILSSCISILLYISGFQIVVRKRVTFRSYASSFQRNIWRRNKRYIVHKFSGLMRNIKV